MKQIAILLVALGLAVLLFWPEAKETSGPNIQPIPSESPLPNQASCVNKEEYLKSKLIVQAFECLNETSLKDFIVQTKEAIERKDVDFFGKNTYFKDISCRDYRNNNFGGYVRSLPKECAGQETDIMVPSVFVGILMSDISEGFPITRGEFLNKLKEYFNHPEPPRLYGVIYPLIYPFGKNLNEAHLLLSFPDIDIADKRILQIFILNKDVTGWKIREVVISEEFKGLLDLERNYPDNVLYMIEQ